PAFLSAVQIPVDYDPEAKCPAWEQFCSEVFPTDAADAGVPFEILAYAMFPGGGRQHAVLCIGEGANGKSVFLSAASTFLGKRNIANLTLHRIEGDRFSASRLVGKLANICSDLPGRDLS